MMIFASASYLMMLFTRLMTVSALFTTKPSYPGSRYTLSMWTSSPPSGTLDQFRYVPRAFTLLWCLKFVKVIHPPRTLEECLVAVVPVQEQLRRQLGLVEHDYVRSLFANEPV